MPPNPRSVSIGSDDVPEPYHRLMRNPSVRWWRPLLGAVIVLFGWAFTEVLIFSIARAIHPDRPTVLWPSLLASNLVVASLIPLSMLVARRWCRQRPGLLSSVIAGLRWRQLGCFVLAAAATELLMLLVIK